MYSPTLRDRLSVEVYGVPGELLFAVVVGAVLRIYRLGAQGLWIDEVFMVTMATERSLWELLFVVPQFEPHPPLYNVFMWVWVGLAGTSEVAMRSSSVAFSIATIPVVYLLVRRLFDRPMAGIVTVLFAISPLQIWYAQEARMYAPLVFLSVASFYLLVSLTDSYSRRVAVGYVAVGVALGYLHIYGLFVLLAQVLFLGSTLAIERELVLSVRRLVAIYGSIGLLTSPWTVLLLHRLVAPEQYPEDAASWLQPPEPSALTETVSLLSFGATRTTRPYDVLTYPPELFFILVVFVLVVFFGLYNMGSFLGERRGFRLVVLWLLVSILVPFVLSITVRPMFELRYAIVAAPAFLILVARGIRSLPSSHLRYAVLVLVVVGMLVPLPGYYADPHKDQWDDAAEYVTTSAESGDVVIVVPGWTENAFRHYFHRESVAVDPLYAFSSQTEFGNAIGDDGDVYLVVSYTNERVETIDNVSRAVDDEPTERKEYVSIRVLKYER